MPDQTHISPDGVKYRLVATRKTTPTTDSEAKKIRVETDSVEVIVSDSRLISRGSQFGHVAIIVDGVAYSRAHEGYDSKKDACPVCRRAGELSRLCWLCASCFPRGKDED